MDDIQKRLENLSPEKLALLMKKLKESRSAENIESIISRRRNTDTYPMSFAQKRLWFMNQLEPESSFYNIPAAIRLTGPLNVNALKNSLDDIGRRHEMLRARFILVKGEPVQKMDSGFQIKIPVVDISGFLPERQNDEIQRLAVEEAKRPFKLDKDPLMRVSLLKVNDFDHVLLITMHHIIADGWSVPVFFRELAILYESYDKGKAVALPDLPIQYADFAGWQHEYFEGAVFDKQLSYWKQQLEGMNPILELPTDFPRPAIQTFEGEHISCRLNPQLFNDLKRIAQEKGISLYMLLLGAFEVLLYRYTGREDFGIGTPVANRNRKEIENLIGFFVNTLVIRAQLDGGVSIDDLLSSVKRTALQAYDNQDLPFEKLVESLIQKRSLSYSPLFQVMFDLQKNPFRKIEFSDLTLELINVERGTAKFDLILTMEETAEELRAVFEYNTALFRRNTVQRMSAHFENILAGMVRNPNQKISELPLLTEPEKHQLLTEWNDTREDYLGLMCIHELFEVKAREVPNNIAVVFGDKHISYDELNRKANRLAHYLIKLGVGPEKLVGINVERSVELIVCVMAILKAGGSYLPLDPSYPEKRVEFILQDTGISILLTQQKLLKNLPSADLRIICIDADWPEVLLESDLNPISGVGPQNLAYVIYTSGSTGNPKGVMITHQSVMNLYHSLKEIIYKSLPDKSFRVSVNAPLFFDASVQQLVMLLNGHTLDIVPNELRLESELFIKYLKEHQINILDCVPSQLKILLASGLLENGKNISAVLPGGEAIDESTWEALSSVQDIRFYNMYGPSECTVDTVICHINRTPDTPVIGRPVKNTRLYILDRNLQPVPVGVPGELFISGDSTGRGYFSRPMLTAEKFLPNPFSDVSGGRMYKTGDLVRYRPNGDIEYLGRTDHQVKIRGFRIELEEIGNVLKQHPFIKDTVVLVREDSPGEKRLVAYVASDNNAAFTARELAGFLKERLPDYMIPSAFVMLEKLPLTPNGKIDRKALPTPEQTHIGILHDFVPPKTRIQSMLAKAMQEIVSIDRVGIHDNFFELGGDSIKAAIFINRVQEKLDKSVPVKAVFLAPTLEELADYLTDHYPEAVRHLEADDSVQGRARAIKRIPRQGNLPLSFAQQRLWFLDKLEPGSPFYNISGAVRLSGCLNEKALGNCVNEVVRRHEILRTTFTNSDGRAAQVISPAQMIQIPVIELKHLSDEKISSEIQRLADEESRTPFDLEKGPLIRASLLRISDQEHIFLLSMHHIISDGWSVGIIIKEVAALYESYLSGKLPQLAELPVQYADYAQWQHEQLKAKSLQTQLAYWKKQLEGIPPIINLPTDFPRPAAQTFRGARQFFQVSRNTSGALRSLCQKENTTLFSLLLSVFQLLLYRYTGQKNFTVGIPVANRNRFEFENMIGFFVNTLVLRADLSDDPDFIGYLKRVSGITTDALANQDVPFEMLVDELQPERNLSYSPLFQVMFVFQNTPVTHLKLAGLTLTPLEMETGTSKFDLTLSLFETEDGMSGFFEYSSDLFKSASVERMKGHFLQLLDELASAPEKRISEFSLLTHTEKTQILESWNHTSTEYGDGQCITTLFEKQAELTPDIPAVVCKNENLTYKELNSRANRLAHYLKKHGAAPEMLIGLSVERSLDLIVGILGILKSGGAYVPLDPKYPHERLSYMLEDTRAPILVTHHKLLNSLPEFEGDIVCLDADWKMIERENGANPDSGISVENAAYVIYTSGSTGKPKGVVVPHKGVGNLANQYGRELKISAGSRLLQFFSFSFDGSVADIFSALLNGGCLFIPAEENLLPGPELGDYIRQEHIDTILMPPTALLLLPTENLPHLKHILSGGSNLTREVAERWLPGRWIYNAYGPTEATVVAVFYKADRVSAEMNNIPIGRPVDNTRIYVLDKKGRPVPVGISGEIHIAGIGLARGYLNRPELTAEKFIPDPFSAESGGRMYSTGDLAKYSDDGNLEYLGRFDHQVKVRGFRIELGEIEAVLKDHLSIEDAIVLLKENQKGENQLAAYIIANGKEVPGTNELRNYLLGILPEYMIPNLFFVMEGFPLSPNGKVDLRALRTMEAEISYSNDKFMAPRNAIERKLAKIWAQLLGLEKVSIRDNFFELGGDSILSIQLVARATQSGIRLTPKQIFQYPTIEGQAETSGSAATVHADQGMASGSAKLTPIQHWFFEQNLPVPEHWNQSVLLEVSEALDATILEKIMRHIIDHHDSLRLRFHRTPSGWVQFYANQDSTPPFHWFDLSGLDSAAGQKKIAEEAAKLQASLNLENAPLMRIAYFDMGDTSPDYLLIIVHHLVVDGVSWRILLEDIQNAYFQTQHGEETKLPVKTTSFQYWAEKLEAYAKSENLKKEWLFWKELVAIRPISLPRDFEHGENTEGSAGILTTSLDARETEILLKEAPGVYKTRIDEILLTALVRAFYDWTGKRSVFINMESHGREHLSEDIDLSRTIGWFTSLFPVYLDLLGVYEIGEMMVGVKEQLHNFLEHHLSYGVLRYLTHEDKIVETIESFPKPEISFNYLGQFNQALQKSLSFKPAGIDKGPERNPEGLRSHILDLSGIITDNCLNIQWIYSTNFHSPQTIEKLAGYFTSELRAVIRHCLSPDLENNGKPELTTLNLAKDDLIDVFSELNEDSADE